MIDHIEENRKPIKVCFAASSGGHLEQLLLMKPLMKKYKSFIVTEDMPFKMDVGDEKVYHLKQVNRKEKGALKLTFKNAVKSLRILNREKPDVIVTTGVLAIVPLCFIGKLMGIKLVYLESFANIHAGTLTGRILYKFADKFFIQWETLKDVYPDAEFVGGIY